MSRKLFASLLMIALGVAAVGAGTWAAYSDTETSTGNTFTAGTLDLTLDGHNDPIVCKFTADGLKPGATWMDAGVIKLKNAGSVDGMLTVYVKNPVNQENGIIEPESASGDVPGVQIDTTGYNADGGDGELWDQASVLIYFDTNNNGRYDNMTDPTVYGGGFSDMTSYYRIPLNTNLLTIGNAWMRGYDGALPAGHEIGLGVLARFWDDSYMRSQPQFNGMFNNQAMGDSFTFDLMLGLDQVH